MEIIPLDLGFQGLEHAIAAYLVRGPAGAILIETGPGSTLQNLLSALAKQGLEAADIRHVLVTHIHLDHAGAAGWWANQGAQIYVHHVGAPHLVDPSRLLASAGRIYGSLMGLLWGETLPAPADRVIPLEDGDPIHVAGLQLTALDTPGHAWHHHVFRLGDVAFAGDAAGVRLPVGEWISVPAPPPEFKLDVWQKTLQRLRAERFAALYLTHFGRVDDVTEHLERFGERLMAAATFIREHMEAGESRDQIVQRYVSWNQEMALAQGVPAAVFEQYEAANPLYMSVDGIMRYWQKQQQKAAASDQRS